jgi:hypothetical protein
MFIPYCTGTHHFSIKDLLCFLQLNDHSNTIIAKPFPNTTYYKHHRRQIDMLACWTTDRASRLEIVEVVDSDIGLETKHRYVRNTYVYHRSYCKEQFLFFESFPFQREWLTTISDTFLKTIFLLAFHLHIVLSSFISSPWF